MDFSFRVCMLRAKVRKIFEVHRRLDFFTKREIKQTVRKSHSLKIAPDKEFPIKLVRREDDLFVVAKEENSKQYIISFQPISDTLTLTYSPK